MNPLVSIIIPVYNAEKYILHCLNSVENQSYNNLEIVVVNDGSTDGSDELCKSYAEVHRNVTVLNQKNMGPSAARNSGIRYAQGEYLFFLDADDLLHPSAIKTLVDNATDNRNLVICDYLEFNNIEECPRTEELLGKSLQYTVKDYLDEVLELRKNTYAWGVLVNKEVAEKNLFPVGKYFEDLATVYKYICASTAITFVDQKLLYYRKSLNSIVATMNSVKCRDYYEAAIEMTSYVKAMYPSLSNSANNFMCYVALQVLAISDSHEDYILQAHRFLKENALMCQKTTSSKSLSLKIRLWRTSEWLYKNTIRIKQSGRLRGAK